MSTASTAVVWVAATANEHKLAEIRAELPSHVELRPRPADLREVDEVAEDLPGNALLKAHAVRDHTGRVALADDTGLEVECLGGRPGVRSARYAGESSDAEANVALLLSELEGVPSGGRSARFRTILVLADPDGSDLVAEGVVEGRIAMARSGRAGFGYDPIFVPEEGDGRTFSEMEIAEKNRIGHRGRAIRALMVDFAARGNPGADSA